MEERGYGDQGQGSAPQDNVGFDKRAFEAAYERSRNQLTQQIEIQQTRLQEIDLNYGLDEDTKERKARRDKKKNKVAKRNPEPEVPVEQVPEQKLQPEPKPEPEQEPKLEREPKLPQELKLEREENWKFPSPSDDEFRDGVRVIRSQTAVAIEEEPEPASDFEPLSYLAEEEPDKIPMVSQETMRYGSFEELIIDDVEEVEERERLAAQRQEAEVKKQRPAPPIEESTAAIKSEISSTIFSLRGKKMFAGLLSLALFYLALGQAFEQILPGVLRFSAHPKTFAIANLVLLALLVPVAVDLLTYGFIDMVHLKFSTMTMIFLLYAVSFAHAILLYFLQGQEGSVSFPVLSCLVAFYVFIYYSMELRHILKIKGDFKRLISKKETIISSITENEEVALACGEEVQEVGIMSGFPLEKGDFLAGFMDKAYENSPIYRLGRIIYPILTGLGLAISLFYGFQNKSVPGAVTALVLFFATAVLFCPEFLVNLPYIWGTRNDKRRRPAVIGFDSLKKFAELDEVVVQDSQLFAGTSIVLSGIKLFGEARIDQIIVETASILKEVNAPAKEALMGAIGNRNDLLVSVGDIDFEAGVGMKAEVNEGTVLLGNREFMLANNIPVPDSEDVGKLQYSGRQGLYVAKDNVLCALVVLAYSIREEAKEMLQRMNEEGIRIHVATYDPLLTQKFLMEQTGISEKNLDLLSVQATNFITDPELGLRGTDDVLVSYGKNAPSPVQALFVCARVRQIVRANLLIGGVGAVVGCILIACLLFGGALDTFSTYNFLLYGFFWMIPSWLLSLSLKF